MFLLVAISPISPDLFKVVCDHIYIYLWVGVEVSPIVASLMLVPHKECHSVSWRLPCDKRVEPIKVVFDVKCACDSRSLLHSVVCYLVAPRIRRSQLTLKELCLFSRLSRVQQSLPHNRMSELSRELLVEQTRFVSQERLVAAIPISPFVSLFRLREGKTIKRKVYECAKI